MSVGVVSPASLSSVSEAGDGVGPVIFSQTQGRNHNVLLPPTTQYMTGRPPTRDRRADSRGRGETSSSWDRAASRWTSSWRWCVAEALSVRHWRGRMERSVTKPVPVTVTHVAHHGVGCTEDPFIFCLCRSV